MQNLEKTLRLASYQGPIAEREPEANLAKTLEVMKQTHDSKVDIYTGIK